MNIFKQYLENIISSKKQTYIVKLQRLTEDRKIFKIIINVVTETGVPIFNIATVIENTTKNYWSMKFNLKQLMVIFDNFLDHSIEEDWDLIGEEGKFNSFNLLEYLNKITKYYNLENNIKFK